MMLGQRTGVSDTGRRRRRNEDAYVVQPPLFAVADGMGGAQAGEVASRLAAEALRDEESGDGAGEERVAQLIQEANRRVYARSHEDASASGMGTTMTVALVDGGRVSIGHVGDSRAYLIRDGRLEQLTEDHSLVAELLRSGQLSPEEAERHPQRSVITRALGTDPDVDVDTFSIDARPGDVFMLCSDGLTTMVPDERILETIQNSRQDLEAAARQLVSNANRGGGEDNITVVFFEIVEEGAASDDTVQITKPVENVETFDEEDTLSGLDAVPAVSTMVVPLERIEAAMAADAPTREIEIPRRRSRGRLVLGVVVLALLGALVALAWWGFLW